MSPSPLLRKVRGWVAAALLVLAAGTAFAQVAPSHDPSRMIRNNDGRYWIFTTGDGIFAMSSPNADFSGWRVEPTVFPVGTWPGWINNYVTGFGGLLLGTRRHQGRQPVSPLLFLRRAGSAGGDRAGDGDQPRGSLDGSGPGRRGQQCDRPGAAGRRRQPLADLGQLADRHRPAAAQYFQRQATQFSRWDLVPGQVEAPYLHKDGSFYYLFFQRGLCCQGVNSGYYTVVATRDAA